MDQITRKHFDHLFHFFPLPPRLTTLALLGKQAHLLATLFYGIAGSLARTVPRFPKKDFAVGATAGLEALEECIHTDETGCGAVG